MYFGPQTSDDTPTQICFLSSPGTKSRLPRGYKCPLLYSFGRFLNLVFVRDVILLILSSLRIFGSQKFLRSSLLTSGRRLRRLPPTLTSVIYRDDTGNHWNYCRRNPPSHCLRTNFIQILFSPPILHLCRSSLLNKPFTMTSS